MRAIVREKKSLRPKSSAVLSEKKVRDELAKTKNLHVLGIDSESAELVHSAVAARFNRSLLITTGESATKGSLCAKITIPLGKRLSDFKMQFFVL
jgi:hypothetical protein